MSSRRLSMLCGCVVAAWASGPARAEDWPTYRHDNARSGVTAEDLRPPLTRQWTFRPKFLPARGWSDYRRNTDRVNYDDAPQVAAVGEAVYFASSGEERVYALDAATGRVRWTRHTDAAARLAPSVWKDRVFVGSDDGWAQCLRASDGTVVWTFRAAPGEDWVLGQGRLMSLWPVRTGVLVEDGRAYLAAGLFPSQGVCLYALGADDGKPAWRRRLDRGKLSPQGHLLSYGERLIVPSGRTPPVAFSRADGKWAGGYNPKGSGSPSYSKGFGGAWAMVAGGRLYNIGAHHVAGYDAASGAAQFVWLGARRVMAHGGVTYLFCRGTIESESGASGYLGGVASDYCELLAIPAEQLPAASGLVADLYRKLWRAKTYGGAKDRTSPALVAQKAKLHAELDRLCKWRLPLKVGEAVGDAMILAGGVLYAGGRGRALAVDAATGKKLWGLEAPGKVRGLAVANGRLLVSSDDGSVLCFAASTPPRDEGVALPRSGKAYPDDARGTLCEAAAAAILRRTGIRRGYCLVLSGGTGRLAFELAKRSELSIHVVEPNERKAAAAREALSAAGLYGGRVRVQQHALSALPYPPFFADLIVCEDSFAGGKPSTPPAEVLRMLRPLGGTVVVGRPSAAETPGQVTPSADLGAWLADLENENLAVEEHGTWTLLRRGPLKGAGSWTHQYADAGNTGCSEDQLAKPPFGILWFGDPGPEKMEYRHSCPASPLSANGRMFVQGKASLMAYDAYNGRALWQRHIPGARRVGTRMEAGNLAATDESLFVALETDGKCLRLDAATGESRRSYFVPPREDGRPRRWGWVATDGKLLYGSRTVSPDPHIWAQSSFARRVKTASNRSECVFAVDIATGQVRWVRIGRQIRNVGIALGDGKLFLVDEALTDAQRDGALRASPVGSSKGKQATTGDAAPRDVLRVVALDAATGAEIWSRGVDVTDCVIGPARDRGKTPRLGGEINLIYTDKILLLSAFPYASKGAFRTGGERRRSIALSADDGRDLWAGATGHLSRPVVVGGTLYAEPWSFDFRTGRKLGRKVETAGCGPMAASAHALFFRGGSTAYYDLIRDQRGTFAGVRPGCSINFIAAGGLVLIPDGSEGCECAWPIKSSLALYPKQ